MRTSRSRVAGALLGIGLAAVLFTGCSGNSSPGTAANQAAPQPADEKASLYSESDAGARQRGPEQQGSDSSTKNRARTTITERAIIRTGTMTIRTKDVRLAADKATLLVGGGDGYVGNIQTTSDDKGRTAGVQVVLRVPVDDYDNTVTELKKLGKVIADKHQSTDVTKDLTDVESRIASQKKSIERLRTLMSQANTVGDVIQVESELATREADLESLQSQQATLSAQATLSTLTVNFEKPPSAPAAAAAEDNTGFLSGLRAGWTALVATVDVGLTVIGALLPFLAGIAVLGALPAWLLIRQRQRRRVTAAPSPEAG